jgi:hypothetical protein
MRRVGGINAVLLESAPGINEATFKLICSNKDPETPRTMEDIDRILSESGIKILQESSSHSKDPVSTGKANQSLLIETTLDDPNIPDKLISDAKNVHEVETSKHHIRKLNEQIKEKNKEILQKETSTDNSDIKKVLDESKSTVRVGEVERA